MTQETGHVNDHVMAGMNSYYQVAAQNECFKGLGDCKRSIDLLLL